MTSAFRIKFWGVRGTVPCPGPDTVRYGGNTACVEVRCGEQLLIFDAGSGIRALGKSLISGNAPVSAHLFLSHTHLDHIIGLPFFKLAYGKGHCIELWGGHLARQGKSLREVLARLMEAPYFPVPMKDMQSCTRFHDFTAGETFALDPGVVITTAPLDHPGEATGYRVDFASRSFAYITDTEHRENELDPRVLALIKGCDLVVYDATYTEAELPRFRGWGHSTWQHGVRLCEAAGAARLVAFHHDPEHSDEFLDAMDLELAAAWPGSFVAREGLEVALS